jgi:parallel beta-helix repeat protein
LVTENTFISNGFRWSGTGLQIGSGIPELVDNNNSIYSNSFIHNKVQVYLDNSINVWDNGYPSGGNYWSDYNGIDSNHDGIGDTLYTINANNIDHYPLMHPYGSVQNLNTSLVYLTIQSAIDAPETLDGHTIFVETGTYYENVVVNKTVSLIGEDKRDTILDGNGTGTGFHILRNDVNITGFTIQNGEPYWLPNAGIYIDTGIVNSQIVGNDIINNKIGVLIVDAWQNYISENDIKNNSEAGFLLWGARHNNITENNIASNYFGIKLDESPVNLFFHNNLVNNTRHVGDVTPAYPSVCVWDDGYPSGGNYWSDYTGSDSFFGAYQNLTGSDGIGDSPYTIDTNNVDQYPLKCPHDYWSNPILGDVNRDMKVDMGDIAQLCDGFGSLLNSSNGYCWHKPQCILCPHCFNLDIDGNGAVNMGDIVTASDNFGKHYP